MSEPYRKKLIEVALPLEAINRESQHEKSVPRKGHPATMHLWWARRPLAACRAVLFASIVDDPSSRPELFPTEEDQEVERQRLFRLIEELVKWENSNNETVLAAARNEILKATDGKPPPVLDPFCGGGSIPLEAHRLGLEAHASDLNPIAVLITKALIEIPPKFAGRPPINADERSKLGHGGTWAGAQGLAEDVRYYGKWMRDRASERIGHLYPKARLPGGVEATVVAWMWARTVKCPNPACGQAMPLIRTFALSTKKGKEVSVDPIIDGDIVRFEVRKGPPTQDGTKRRGESQCLFCGTTIDDATLRAQSQTFGIGNQLLAVVAEGAPGRVYLSPTDDHETLSEAPPTPWLDNPLPENARWFSPPLYGMTTYRDLFTPRQIVALVTLSDLLGEAREAVLADGGDESYADAISTYLAFAIDKFADWSSGICSWINAIQGVRNTFARQAIPMVWDYVEINPFSASTGNFGNHCEWVADGLQGTPVVQSPAGWASQLDASAAATSGKHIVATDPPYYDNIGYADLSDFFYVWLRHSLGRIYPDLFSTVLTPKSQELVATPYRFEGDRRAAERFFEQGLSEAFALMRDVQDPGFPLTLFYAFKQAESNDGAAPVSTGWDTMLSALIQTGFVISGTWPMRTERTGRSVGIGTNALASSIVLVCRARPIDAPVTTRRDFVDSLRAELPAALRQLQHGNVAPVDLAQAAIGPGMAIFSRYARVIEASGEVMTVRTALGLINTALDEILAEQERDFDGDTRFAVTWFEQRGTGEGPYGEADVLARAKNTAVRGLEEAGILRSHAGKVRLLGRTELSDDWDPATDRRLTVWEVTQHLIRTLEVGGETEAAELLRRLGGLGEAARELAYRLYTICERKGWAQEALGCNALVVSWPEIARLAAGQAPGAGQQRLGV